MTGNSEQDASFADLPITLPKGVNCTMRGGMEGDTEDSLSVFCNEVLSPFLAGLSEVINLSSLDGITVTFNMAEAIENLDFGVEVEEKIMPTNDETAACVGKVQSVIRDGELKSHMILYHPAIRGLEQNQESEGFQESLHTLAHECAHVEATSVFHKLFPEVLLAREVDGWDYLDDRRWIVAILPCWDEFAASAISAPFGKNPMESYMDVFLKTLEDSEARRMAVLRQCHKDKDWRKAWEEMFQVYGTLMKYACYVLGTMRQLQLELNNVPLLADALSDNWFRNHFLRLSEICGGIADAYGQWENKAVFEPIGNLLEEVVSEKGVTITRLDNGDFHVGVTFPLSIVLGLGRL